MALRSPLFTRGIRNGLTPFFLLSFFLLTKKLAPPFRKT